MEGFECRKIELKFDEKIIFHEFNFVFFGPGIVLIEGENGVGKSSALKLFAGFLKPTQGHIQFFGKPIDQFKVKEFSFLAATSLGLLNDLTGLEHIHVIADLLGIKSEITETKINEFQSIEIFDEILSKRVADFSQGMRQLLRLFLHLFFEPKIIFLDEPFLYLSPKLKAFIQEKIENIATSSIVFVTDQEFSWFPKGNSQKILLGGQ